MVRATKQWLQKGGGSNNGVYEKNNCKSYVPQSS